MTWLDDVTFETVIVNTTYGEAFRGLLASCYDDCLVLREARLLQGDGLSEVIEGPYVIPREMVGGIQMLSSGA